MGMFRFQPQPPPDASGARAPFDLQASIRAAGNAPFVRVGEVVSANGRVTPQFAARSQLTPLLLDTLAREQDTERQLGGRLTLAGAPTPTMRRTPTFMGVPMTGEPMTQERAQLAVQRYIQARNGR